MRHKLITRGLIAIAVGVTVSLLLQEKPVRANINDAPLFSQVLAQNTAARQWFVDQPFAAEVEYAIEHHALGPRLDREIARLGHLDPGQSQLLKTLEKLNGHVTFGEGNVAYAGDYRKEMFEVTSTLGEHSITNIRLINPDYALVKIGREKAFALYKKTDSAVNLYGEQVEGYAGSGTVLSGLYEPVDLRYPGFGFVGGYLDEQVAQWPAIQWRITEEPEASGGRYLVTRHDQNTGARDMELIIDPRQGYLITNLKTYDSEGEVYEEMAVRAVEFETGLWFPSEIMLHRPERTTYVTIKNVELLSLPDNESAFSVAALSRDSTMKIPNRVPVAAHEADGSVWTSEIHNGRLIPRPAS